MRLVKALSLILLCAASVRVAIAQAGAKENAEAAPQARRDGVITGRVVNDVGRPVAGAPILVIKSGVKITSGIQTSTADDEGNFKVTGLGPGSYMIDANVPGYVIARTGSERDYHRPGASVTINLVKGGVITGRVTDPYGEPMVGVRAQVFKVRELEDGRKYLGELREPNGRLTDDRGVYRLYGLEPGVYVVGASNDHSGMFGREAMTWHPSSPRATAAEITVRGGEEVAGIDIRNREERGYMISGTVLGAAAPDPRDDRVTVILTSGVDRQLVGMTWPPGTKGFAMFGALDGEYEIAAFRMSRTQTDFASSAPHRVVVKGADVSGIELRIAPPASVSGRVKVEAGGAGKSLCEDVAQARATVEEVLLSAAPDDESRPSIQAIAPYFRYFSGAMGGAPDEKGEFTLGGLAAGRFRIKADLPDDGWYVRAITQPAPGAGKKPADASLNGLAVKAGEKLSGVEVVIAEGAASLNGRVVPMKDASRLPARLRVHLIPAEVSAADDVLRYAETAVGVDGGFGFKHVAPGKYLLHTRQASEKEANNDRSRPLAWDAVERAKIRREAAAAKNEIELKACERWKDYVLRLNR
ncbi:MAG TPA: carboxypeptidase-like regulatory domain-containing protein [Blastocatellia bacterium]|nr:carboxypeptidase-like regulatory domain-containing protein [Blastocatellia bacterium]